MCQSPPCASALPVISLAHNHLALLSHEFTWVLSHEALLDMSSSHYGVHSSYLRVLSARDAHVLLGLTLLQFYLGYLETHFICKHKMDQSSPATEAQNPVVHTYLRHKAQRAWQPASSFHGSPTSRSCLHSWHLPFRTCLILAELGQSLQSLSQDCCLRKGIHVKSHQKRHFMQEEVKFFYQAFSIKHVLCKHDISRPVTK